MANSLSRQEKKELLSSYFASLSFGLLTLLFGTISITFGFLPLLEIKVFEPSEWLAGGIALFLGFLAFETGLQYRFHSDVVIEYRKRQLSVKGKKLINVN
jgi:uncharacterized membrane protein YjjP (DUF1212 family)